MTKTLEAHAVFVNQVTHDPDPSEIVRAGAAPPAFSGRKKQSLFVVYPERLGVHAQQLCGDADETHQGDDPKRRPRVGWSSSTPPNASPRQLFLAFSGNLMVCLHTMALVDSSTLQPTWRMVLTNKKPVKE